MAKPLNRILTGIVFFVVVCLLGIAGYMLAGWEMMDALYMVVITIFGVGYGEVQPVQSPAFRVLTISTIIAGYAAVIYTVGGFVQMVIDGELNKALGVRKMTREIENLHGHAVICGVGRMGTILSQELRASNKSLVIVDCDEDRLQQAENLGHLVVKGDAADESVLEMAGIRRASVLATVLSDDATNVFVTITAREMNPKLFIIARGENPRTERKLLGCGADRVILPTAIGAKKVAQLIIRPTAENLLEQLASRSDLNAELGEIGLQFHELVVNPSSEFIGKPLSDVKIDGHNGLLIVAIRHAEGSTTLNPPPSTQLYEGDTVIVIGHAEDLPTLKMRFSSQAHPTIYRGVKLNA